MEKEQWLAERKKGLGASDVPIALGFSPWKTPLELWLEKRGDPLAPTKEATDVMQWGLDVETGIARAYERMTGRILACSHHNLVHHPQYPELFATPDGFTQESTPRLVQLKWSRRGDGFGDPGTSEIPDAYLIQTACEMACAGCDLEDLAAMIIGPPVLIYPLHRDHEFERDIVDAARAWWHDYVVKGVEPPIGFSQPWGAYLTRKFPVNTGEWIELNGKLGDPLQEEIDDFLRLQREADEANDREEEAKNRLKAFIADRDGIRWPGGQISWKRSRDVIEPVTDYQMALTELCLAHKIPLEEARAIISKHTSEVVTHKGSRRFVITI